MLVVITAAVIPSFTAAPANSIKLFTVPFI
jgi:hypothetical protein